MGLFYYIYIYIFIAMRIFNTVVRRKYFLRDQKQSTENKLNELNEEEESRFMATDLNTSLKPTFGIETVKQGSDNLEGLLMVV